jgi:hypothetical protein
LQLIIIIIIINIKYFRLFYWLNGSFRNIKYVYTAYTGTHDGCYMVSYLQEENEFEVTKIVSRRIFEARRRTILNLGLQATYCSLSSVMQLQWVEHIPRIKERRNTQA